MHSMPTVYPAFPPPRAEFKIVPKTTEKTLKISLASEEVRGARLYSVLKLQVYCIKERYQIESQHLN